MMAGIGSRNTRPEMTVRRGLHARGLRYQLHARDLPGKPDLVFPGRRAVIFVQGCFWHGHGCALFRWPSTRTDFWKVKIAGNIARDQRVREQLRDEGWRILDVWECALKGKNRIQPESVIERCCRFLDGAIAEDAITCVPCLLDSTRTRQGPAYS